ncbi:MAG: M23 family metallopeptidase [Butyricicoccus sp.]
MTNRQQKRSGRVTRGDVRLLLSAALFLGAVMLKISGAPWAESVRAQAVSALSGGISTDEVLQAAGHTFEDGSLQAVFAGFGMEDDSAPQGNTDSADPQPDTAQVYAESGYGEDELKNRETSNFPKEADETAYIFRFDTQNPVQGTKTSDYGMRTHPITGKESFHYGLDIGASEGTPIAAFADGIVRETGFNTYGNYVVLDHPEGISTLYAHCSRVDVQEGETVSMGDKIAEVGATGNATGNHLHLEIWRDGKTLDPAHYISV